MGATQAWRLSWLVPLAVWNSTWGSLMLLLPTAGLMVLTLARS